MSTESIQETTADSAPSTAGVRRRWRVSSADDSAGVAAVLQRRADAPAGLLHGLLVKHGFRVSTVRLDLGEPLPDPASVRLAVVLGSDGAADESARLWTDAQLDWLREADQSGTAVLGVGSGAHALAVAMGGATESATRSRHGWIQVSSDVPRWIASGPWLAWNEDVLRPPHGSRVLAHSSLGAEAFTINGHLGVRFHPEVTPEIVRDWVTRPGDRVLDSQGILEATWRDQPEATAATHRLVSGFVQSLDPVAAGAAGR